jgi:hypothetical protein
MNMEYVWNVTICVLNRLFESPKVCPPSFCLNRFQNTYAYITCIFFVGELTPVILGVPEIRTRRAEKLIAAADENCNGHWFETLRPSDFLIV